MNHQLVKTTSSTQSMQYKCIIYKQFGPRAFAEFSVGELVPNVGSSAESKDHAINWNQITSMVCELVKLELSLRTADILPPGELLKYTCWWWVVRMVRNVKGHPSFISAFLSSCMCRRYVSLLTRYFLELLVARSKSGIKIPHPPVGIKMSMHDSKSQTVICIGHGVIHLTC